MTNGKVLAQFGLWCLRQGRKDGGCDIDGGDLQDEAERLGLLIRVAVDKPCSEDCFCASYYGDFPVECLREHDQEPEPRKDNDVSTEQLGKLIEKARQAVKPVIKRELEGEVLDQDVLGGGGVSESHAQFCQREVDWYLKHGKYPNTRITSTSDGLRFVIGDWAWHRAHPRHEEHIEDRMKRAGITAFPPERKDAPEHGSSEPRDS